MGFTESRSTPGQDSLRPLCWVPVGVYLALARAAGPRSVPKMALVCTEPLIPELAREHALEFSCEHRFSMHMSAPAFTMGNDREETRILAKQARGTYEAPPLPAKDPPCRDGVEPERPAQRGLRLRLVGDLRNHWSGRA